jgi:hypothetical protein
MQAYLQKFKRQKVSDAFEITDYDNSPVTAAKAKETSPRLKGIWSAKVCNQKFSISEPVVDTG